MLDESSGACRNQKARSRAMKRELEHSIKSFLSRLAIKLRLLLLWEGAVDRSSLPIRVRSDPAYAFRHHQLGRQCERS
jgi:hypothetical protein